MRSLFTGACVLLVYVNTVFSINIDIQTQTRPSIQLLKSCPCSCEPAKLTIVASDVMRRRRVAS